MTYRINGEKVTLEEFRRRGEIRRKNGIIKPIKSGDRLNIHASAFEGFVSPVNGEYIDSKHALREHEKKNDVVQVGSDYDSKFNKIKEESNQRKQTE